MPRRRARCEGVVPALLAPFSDRACPGTRASVRFHPGSFLGAAWGPPTNLEPPFWRSQPVKLTGHALQNGVSGREAGGVAGLDAATEMGDLVAECRVHGVGHLEHPLLGLDQSGK